MTDQLDRILLTGATGYVGGCLLQCLERDHQLVRCLTRRPSVLRHRVASTTEVVVGDLLANVNIARANAERYSAAALMALSSAPELSQSLLSGNQLAQGRHAEQGAGEDPAGGQS